MPKGIYMGKYINSNLAPNEFLIDETRFHWTILIQPILFITLTMIFGILLYDNIGIFALYLGCGLLIIGILLFLSCLKKYLGTEMALTNYRLVIKTGFISREALDISLKQVEGVQIKQTVMGRIFNYGSLQIRGTGSGKISYSKVTDPYSFQKSINDAIHKGTAFTVTQENKNVNLTFIDVQFPPIAIDNKKNVIKLALEGWKIDEISKALKLSEAEVKSIIEIPSKS